MEIESLDEQRIRLRDERRGKKKKKKEIQFAQEK